MGDVDAILAGGFYVDGRGERWIRLDYGAGCYEWQTETAHYADPIAHGITPDQMRVLIARDLHRAECPGLDSCGTHPVVTVAKGALGGWVAFPPHYDAGRAHTTFAEAIAAAHNTTGEHHG